MCDEEQDILTYERMMVILDLEWIIRRYHNAEEIFVTYRISRCR